MPVHYFCNYRKTFPSLLFKHQKFQKELFRHFFIVLNVLLENAFQTEACLLPKGTENSSKIELFAQICPSSHSVKTSHTHIKASQFIFTFARHYPKVLIKMKFSLSKSNFHDALVQYPSHKEIIFASTPI